MARENANLIGQRFGKLTVVAFAGLKEIGSQGRKVREWSCACECGGTVVCREWNLKSLHSRSCGCLNYRHGRATRKSDPAYASWRHMKERCLNPQNHAFRHYGGRGITVCDRWRDSFENFLADMGDPPEGCSLDRIDVNGDYCKDNCRWATDDQQARNRRDTVWVNLEGQDMCLKEACRKVGMKYPTAHKRLRRGMPLPFALTTAMEKG